MKQSIFCCYCSLFPFSLETFQPWHSTPKSVQKDPLRITTHTRLAFFTPLTIPTQKPPSKGIPPSSLLRVHSLRIPRILRPLGARGTLRSRGLGRFLLLLVHLGSFPAGLAQHTRG